MMVGRTVPGEPASGDRPSSVRLRLAEAFGGRVRAHMPLAAVTTFRAGGAADWMLETSAPDDLVAAVRVTRELGLSLTVLGGGSNVLVGDLGVRGLVVRVRHGAVTQIDSTQIRAEGGVTINGLVRWTIQRELAGLERWAGTPGTVGGAVHGNAHFDGRLLGDMVNRVGLVDAAGGVSLVPVQDMGFGYDECRIQHTGELVLWADFRVEEHAIRELRAAARESLAFRKRTQPLNRASAGCVFRNPRAADGPLPDGVPRSAGALIDRAGLKGCSIGRAVVSHVHGNFIVNEGGATAADVRALVGHVRNVVADRFGIVLREELIYVGEFE